jgi:hypothetical protein
MISPMDYRRGFQRVYAVAAIVWIGGALIALPSDRVRFWAGPDRVETISQEEAGRWLQAQYKARSRPVIAFVNRLVAKNFGKLPPEQDLLRAMAEDPEFRKLYRIEGIEVRPPTAAPERGPTADSWAEEFRSLRAEQSEARASRTRRLLWLLGVLFVPPVAFYVAGFYAAPWIADGFKSGADAA